MRKRNLLPIPDYEVIANMIQTGFYVGILPSRIAERRRLTQVGAPIRKVTIGMIYQRQNFQSRWRGQLLDVCVSALSGTS